MLRGLEQDSQRWQHEYRRRNYEFFFLGLVHMRLKKYRLDVLNVGNSVFKANVFFFYD